MHEQQKLEVKVGEKESKREKLEPKNVEVKSIKIEKVGENKIEKVVLLCKHPDKKEEIVISAVEYMEDKKVMSVALWYNLDDEKNIQKGSATAHLITFFDCTNLKELIGKQLPTIDGDSGYLIIKAY